MQGRTLHLHEARIGIGLPAKTVRPYRRQGDVILDGFLTALSEPADRVLLTGRLFEQKDPPAHLVDRVVAPLGELVRRGIPVEVPEGTPRGLLFVSAGVDFGREPAVENAPEFFRSGAYRVLGETGDRLQNVPMPGIAEVRVDVTGLDSPMALDAIREALLVRADARFVQLTLTGHTDEHEVATFGPRELRHHLPGGVDGLVTNRISREPGPKGPEGDEERRAALNEIRESLPEAPDATGVYEFLDERGRVLYVGKAVSMKRRVASHFTAELRTPSPRGPMLHAARSLFCREVPSELEALLTEADRIREARPPYNRQMREPEGYRYLRADVDGPTPGLSSVRRAREDGAVYIGPFPKRWTVERSIRVLQVVYGLKSCDWRRGEPVPAACTDRDLSICSAPCTDRVGDHDYRHRVCMALDYILGVGDGEPPFGSLNSPSAGLLALEDLRILEGFARSARRFVMNLRDASGGIPLPGERLLLVLGGLRAQERRLEPDGVEEADGWIADRVAEFESEPPRTWVTPAEADEVRILSHWLRRIRKKSV